MPVEEPGPPGTGDPPPRNHPVAAPEPKARFCPACGSKLVEPMVPCTVCAARLTHPRLGPVGEGTVPLKAALGLYFVLLGMIIATMIWAVIVGDDATPRSRAGLDIAAGGLVSLVVLAASIPGRRHLRAPLGTAGPARYYALAPLIGIVTFAVASLIVRSASALLGLTDVRYIDDYVGAGYSWVVPLISVAVQPAVFEELAFRGIIGSALERVLDSREALVVTALLFAALHLSPAAFPHLFLMGLALGWLRRRSGSLYPCMLLHFCHNGLVLAVEYLGG